MNREHEQAIGRRPFATATDLRARATALGTCPMAAATQTLAQFPTGNAHELTITWVTPQAGNAYLEILATMRLADRVITNRPVRVPVWRLPAFATAIADALDLVSTPTQQKEHHQ